MRVRLAAIAALFAGAAIAAPAFADDLVRVGNPAGDDFHFSFANVGTEAGIFKKNGVELQIISLAGGAKLHAAMTAGSLDIALGSGTDFGLIVKGAPEKGVGVLATKPSNIVIQGNTKNGITTIAALKGKKVGVSSVGALTYWMAQKLAQHEGWGLNGMELVATGGGQANVAGFETGSLDAAVTSLEAAMRIDQMGKGKILLSFGDIVDPFIAHVIYATNDMIAQHPDTIRRFLKAWYETVAYAQTHKAETIKYSQPVTLLTDDLASKVYDVEMPTFSTDGRFDPKGLAAVKQAMLDLGTVKEAPDDKAVFTEEFLPKK
ncbi:MAG TPA: ABC transporter substrate-binding protein [Stellaceae bacterium]|jgi:NitT/TauT family transport system substrate-binding protein|nr:ABC transporter substrate-binding protein [Stellaceae bacterium]